MSKNLLTILIFLKVIFFQTHLFSADLETKLLKYDFSFKGVTGYIDKSSAQRGLQVYIEICSSCHSMKHLSYRNLYDLGYAKKQIQKIAAEFEVIDGPDSNGEFYNRKALISDTFADPYANANEAKSLNNGAYPPDLSLIIKARYKGPDYLRSLLLGYEETPEGMDIGDGYYNKYMPGNIIAMPQPLYGNDVEYMDGTESGLDQEVIDIVTFLTWASMPELEKRRRMGIKTIIFLIIMTTFFYFSYKKIWARVK